MKQMVQILEYDGNAWHKEQTSLEAFLQRPHSSGTRVILLEAATFASDTTLRSRLQGRYRIPYLFWTTVCKRSTGYFGSEDVYNDDRELLSHNTWFRFQIKQLWGVPKVYTWYDFTFFTNWERSGAHTIICFDANPDLHIDLYESLVSQVNTSDTGVYVLHSALLSLILELYDKSVWTLRDYVRDVEKKRMGKPQSATNYPYLHEIARHACHSSETLQVAIETVSNLYTQYCSFSEDQQVHTSTIRLRQYLNFQKQMFQGLYARSLSIEARLKNELNLAINLVTQQESAATVRISQAARSDGAAMRAVAVVTLVFLPSTFVSTIFSTTFFAFIPGSDGTPESWAISEKFWVYWVFSLPLTIAAMGAWLWWQQRYGGASQK